MNTIVFSESVSAVKIKLTMLPSPQYSDAPLERNAPLRIT